MTPKESISTIVYQKSYLILTVIKCIKNNAKSYGEHEYVLGFTIKGNGGDYKVRTALI